MRVVLARWLCALVRVIGHLQTVVSQDFFVLVPQLGSLQTVGLDSIP